MQKTALFIEKRRAKCRTHNKQFGVSGGVARSNLCIILQVSLPREPQ